MEITFDNFDKAMEDSSFFKSIKGINKYKL